MCGFCGDILWHTRPSLQFFLYVGVIETIPNKQGARVASKNSNGITIFFIFVKKKLLGK